MNEGQALQPLPQPFRSANGLPPCCLCRWPKQATGTPWPSCFSDLLWKFIEPPADHACVHTELPRLCFQCMSQTASADCQNRQQAHPGPAASLTSFGSSFNHLQVITPMMQDVCILASNACCKQLQLVARRGSKQGLAQLSRLALSTVTATLINVHVCM